MRKMSNYLLYKILVFGLLTICIVNFSINKAFTADKIVKKEPLKNVAIKTNPPSVIHFTQAYCRDCHVIKPYILNLEKQYKGKVSFKIIDIKNEDTQTKDLIKKYRIFGVPTTVFVNRYGEKQKVLGGAYTENKYKEETAALLKK